MSPSTAICPLVCCWAYAQIGESASMASSLPLTTAVVAASCAGYGSIVISGLPAALHLLLRAGRSSVCWTVSFWTATFLPQGSSGLIPAGLPFLVAHWVPAE